MSCVEYDRDISTHYTGVHWWMRVNKAILWHSMGFAFWLMHLKQLCYCCVQCKVRNVLKVQAKQQGRAEVSSIGVANSSHGRNGTRVRRLLLVRWLM